jgi:hypothetical protein
MDTRTPSEMAIVADRIVGDVTETPDPALHERVAALKIAGDITAGNRVAVRRFLHELQYGLSPWKVDPWVLLGEAAGLLISRRAGQTQAVAEPAPEPETVPAAAVPEVAPEPA